MKIKAFRIMQVKGVFSTEKATTDLKEMCRYDCAFINTTEFPRIVVFPRFHDRRGTFGGNITHSRWASFQMHLNACSVEQDKLVLASLKNSPELWVTYQHPKDEQGRICYRMLAPFSLDMWQSVKDMNTELFTWNNRYCSAHLTIMTKVDQGTMFMFKCCTDGCDHVAYAAK